MMTDFESAARVAVQITRAAPLFDQLVDVLLSHAALAADASTPADAVAGQTELRVIRERLDAHYLEFQSLYFELLRKHLGPRLPAVLEALSNDHVQAYLKAQKSMEHELIDELQRLAEKMASIVPIEAGEPEPSPIYQRLELVPRATKLDEPSCPGRDATTVSNATLPLRESAATCLDSTLPMGAGSPVA